MTQENQVNCPAIKLAHAKAYKLNLLLSDAKYSDPTTELVPP